MRRENSLKYIKNITAISILSTIGLTTTYTYANNNQTQNDLITELNLINIGNMEDISEYINEEISYENKIILSNIKNIYQQNNDNQVSNDIETNTNDNDESINQEDSDKEIYSLNQIPTIAANIVSSIDNTVLCEPYVIKEIDEAKVGIIGIVSKDHEINIENNIVIEDEIETINKYTKELVEQGIKNIVVLTDMKLSKDDTKTEDGSPENLDAMNIDSNMSNIYENIDNEVDIIINENELNEENESINIEKEDSDLLLIQTDEKTIADIKLSINKEDNSIENKAVSFINKEELIVGEDKEIETEDDIIVGEDEEIDADDVILDEDGEINKNEDEQIESESEDVDDKDDVSQIQLYVVGGTSDPNNQNPPNNSSQDEDDEEKESDKEESDDSDKDEESDDKEDDDNEDTEEKENDKESDDNKDDKEDDDDKDNEEEDDDKETSNNNPKTGDTSIIMYVIGCLGATVGLKLNKKEKE